MTIIKGSSLKIQQGSAVIQYLAAVTGSLNIITSGMHYGWPSPSLPILENNASTIPITSSQGSWIAIMPLFGAVLGAVTVGVTVDIVGRKRTMLISCIPFFLSWIMIAFASSVEVLYIARFIAGVADGSVFTATPMYIGEIADPKIRGMLGSGVSVLWILGILLANIIGSYLGITATALVCSSLPLISLLTFIFMPASPYYLVMKDNLEGARQSLQKLRGIHDVDDELTRINLAVEAQNKDKGNFLDLFRIKENRKAAIIMAILRGFQQLSGTLAVTFYAQSIFAEAGDNISSELATIIYCTVQLVMAGLSSTVVDRTGRRPLLIISIFGSAVFLFIEGVYFYIKSCTTIDVEPFSIIPVVGLIGFVIIFSLGMQTVPILMLGELFSSNVKAFALCLADVYFAIIASIVSKFFQIMKDSFGMYTPFFAFSACCLIGLVLIILFVPETKGKTLEDIQSQLKGKHFVRNNEKKVSDEA